MLYEQEYQIKTSAFDCVFISASCIPSIFMILDTNVSWVQQQKLDQVITQRSSVRLEFTAGLSDFKLSPILHFLSLDEDELFTLTDVVTRKRCVQVTTAPDTVLEFLLEVLLRFLPKKCCRTSTFNRQ